MSIPGFSIFTNFDPDESNLGTCGKRGMCIYIADDIQPSEIHFNTSFEEHMWAKVKLMSNDWLLIGNIYRSPSSDNGTSTSNLCDLIDLVCSTKPSFLLLTGDFNYPGIDWTQSFPLASNHFEQMFIDTIQQQVLHQMIFHPTRYRTGSQPHLLDLVLTNEPNMVKDINYLPGLGMSDHVCVFFSLECFVSPVIKQTPKYNFHQADYVRMKQLLSEVNWNELLDGLNVNLSWQRFNSELNKIIQLCVPIETSSTSRKKKCPYVNAKVLKLRYQKELLWSKYCSSRNSLDYSRYTQIRNRVRKLTRSLRISYETKIAQSIRSNPKQFWNYVRNKTKVKSSIPNMCTSVDSVATTDSEKAAVLNSYFASVFTKENLSNLPQMDRYSYCEPLSDIDITIDLVLSKLKSLSPNKSPGPDGYHPKLLNQTAEQLCLPLCLIYRKSLAEGLLPSDWKVANVIPVFKKGDRHQPNNYRPISLTSVVCKVFESIIKDSIVGHMMKNNLFSKMQHGFLPKRSCITQLLVATEYWSKALSQGDAVDVIYFDFKKAFDSVPHQRLLIKLKAYGIDGPLFHWIDCFLSNRKQRVVINDTFSTWSEVLSGIPQGSVLGPVLFSLYINDLPAEMQNPVLLFADDTKIFCKVNKNDGLEDIARIQQDIDRMYLWSEKWQLFFNISKCKSLHLGRLNPKHVYQMNGQDIVQTSAEKDLGVTIDDLMKYHRHTQFVASKANRTLGLIKKSFINISKETFTSLYKTVVRPQIEYGNVIWGPFYSLDQDRVERIQRRATKLVPCIRHLTYQQRLQALGLPSLKYRRLRGDMITVYNIFHHNYDLDVNEFFSFPTYNTTRGHPFKIFKQHISCDVRAHSFSQRIVNTWNELPTELVTAPTLGSFKRQFDSFCSNKFYTS